MAEGEIYNVSRTLANGEGETDLTLAAGDQIGPFKLMQPLGKGGMGEVWMAEQLEPVKRRVALKVIRGGLGTKEVLRRFEAERQALAMMNHPNIARILDAGTTPAGQPYFAMELVTGKQFTSYCDANRLSIDERLKLFVAVCNGVQHAHQKGVIHRDLKPGNILVTVIDGVAVPKIIDFGLAKATDCNQRLTDQSLFTGIGQLLGTLKYMSPEQACLDNLDIDTRTDIYALGVILYELLTGSTPLDDPSIQGQAALKVLEFIRENEPLKPSSRLASSTDKEIQSITGQRRTDSVRLKRLLLGDLDWIVMKALEKNRTRRYESASGFAADIERCLSNEPVVARPPSLAYRMQKFVRKNRLGVITSTLVFLALVSGIVGTSAATIRAMKAEALAKDRLKDALAAKNQESQQRQLAERRKQEASRNLAFARKGNEILGSVFSRLDPKAEYATVADLRIALSNNLQQAVSELEGTAIGDPQVVAEMQNTLGLSLLGLGESTLAIALFQQASETRVEALGPEHPDSLASMSNLAISYRATGQYEHAMSLLEENMELCKTKFGLDHPLTLVNMNNLAECYRAAGQLDRARPLLEVSLELSKRTLGIDHPKTLTGMNNLATFYRSAGLPSLALPLLEKTLQIRQTILGSDHPDTLSSMNNLAAGYLSDGQLGMAMPVFEELLKLQTARLGPEHPDTLGTMNNLAVGYYTGGRFDRALPLYETTVQIRRSMLGNDHPDTIASMSNLGEGYLATEQFDRALPLLQETLELARSCLGDNHPTTLASLNNLAGCYWSLEQYEESIPLFEEQLSLTEEKYGRDHVETQLAAANLGVNYRDAKRLNQALPLLEEAYRSSKKLANLSWVRQPLLDAYLQAGKLPLASRLINEILHDSRQSMNADSPKLAAELVAYGFRLLESGAFVQAEPLLREGLAIREKIEPDAWTTFNTQSLVGGTLLGQKKYKEAELLLVSGFEGMKQRESDIPAQAQNRIPQALERLVELFGAVEKIDAKRKYEQELMNFLDSNEPKPVQ